MAAAINLKRLAAALLVLILPWMSLIVRLRLQTAAQRRF